MSKLQSTKTAVDCAILLVSLVFLLTAIYATQLLFRRRSIKKLVFYVFCTMTLVTILLQAALALASVNNSFYDFLCTFPSYTYLGCCVTHQLKVANLICIQLDQQSALPPHLKEQRQLLIKYRLGLTAWVFILVLAVVYFVYFTTLVIRSDGIEWRFFSSFVVIYLLISIVLAASTFFYSHAMHSMWGNCFDSAIKRVNILTIALVLGLLASSAFMIALVESPAEAQLALTTGNTFSLLLPLAVMMFVHIQEFRTYR